MIVKLKTRHPGYPDLSQNQPYLVIGIEADDYRIMNDAGKPYLLVTEIQHSGVAELPRSAQGGAERLPGSNWKFLKYEKETIFIDFDEYLISQVSEIVVILVTNVNAMRN